MKAIIIFILSIAIVNNCFSQTREKEVQYLDQAYRNGHFTSEQYQQLAKDWRELLAVFGEYPSLPFDEELQTILFKYVNSYPYKKETIYKRILEWAAISFGSLKDVLHYEDYESGKIILKGYFDVAYLQDITIWFKEKETINSAKCSHTYMFTIKEGKLKVNVIDLKYEFKLYSYGTVGSYESTYTRNLDSLYPVTKGDPGQWKSNLTILKNTDLKINSLINSLDTYINNYESDYEF